MFFSQNPTFMNFKLFLSIPTSRAPFLFLKLIAVLCVEGANNIKFTILAIFKCPVYSC